MSDSVWPHRWQPTRLPHAWDSPDKNTGVGCHFLLQCMKVKSESKVAQSCLTLSDPMDCSLPGSSIHGIFQARVLEWGAIAFSDQTRLNKPMQSSHYCLRACVCSVESDSLQPYGLQPARLLHPWNFLGKNTGVGCQFLFQGILPTQGSHLWLLPCKQILYHWAIRETLSLVPTTA